jgi:hypothetical protein
MKKLLPALLATASIGLLAAGSAHATTNLVQNGSFEDVTNANGQASFNSTINHWNVPALNGSYVFIFSPGTADTTGSLGQYGVVKLWGPGDGSNNGLPATSPDGGNYIASDPAFHNGMISQSITGLNPGTTYKVNFDWAGAQQENYQGPTTEGWNVSLDGTTKSTGTVGIVSHGFSGWMNTSLFFKADSATETLSFLAIGGPNASLPPFALLDGVTMTAVPEPATWAVMLLGFGGVGAAIRSRRKQVAAA